MHFHTELAINKKNARETWKIIQSVLPSKPSRKAPFTVKVDKMPSKDPSVVANKFNNFCAIGPNLAETIEHISNKRPEDFFPEKVIPFIYFEPPALTEVFDQIVALKDKAEGHDNLSSFSKLLGM